MPIYVIKLHNNWQIAYKKTSGEIEIWRNLSVCFGSIAFQNTCDYQNNLENNK